MSCGSCYSTIPNSKDRYFWLQSKYPILFDEPPTKCKKILWIGMGWGYRCNRTTTTVLHGQGYSEEPKFTLPIYSCSLFEFVNFYNLFGKTHYGFNTAFLTIQIINPLSLTWVVSTYGVMHGVKRRYQTLLHRVDPLYLRMCLHGARYW